MKATHKMVDGVRVDLSPKEAAKIEAEWVKFNAKLRPPRPQSNEERISELEKRLKKLETKPGGK